MMRTSRKLKHQAIPTFAFVVDGETEIWYLQMLKRNERNLRLNIKPEIPHKKNIEDQFKLVADLSAHEYSKVFWIVDLDTIIKESRETPKGKKSTLSSFIACRKQIEKDFSNVIIITNNPCLEYWFVLHFENTSKLFETCSKAENQLKTHLIDYEKTLKYFTRQDNDIYLKLRPYLKTATTNAKSLGLFDNEEPLRAICEMHLLFGSDEMKNLLIKSGIH
jgi:hypothetical protein